MSLADSAERIVYRVGGLPVAIRGLFGTADPLRSAFTRRYWHPNGMAESIELVAGLLIWPFGLVLASAWYTWRNGPIIRRRDRTKLSSQVAQQFRFYFSEGVLAPWYYIFSLHDRGADRASTFIQRFETKTCYFRVLKRRKGTPLNDKLRFSEFCADRGIRSIPILLSLDGRDPGCALPDRDLFVKPTAGRGGRGAERWDSIAHSRFRSAAGEELSATDLLRRLVERSARRHLIIQPRMLPHHDLAALTAGALPTVRVLTCLDERGEPEIMAAMMRMSFGKNRTVDNLHAGGIGALVDLDSGKLSQASNLGSDAHLGWFAAHPDSGARIEGHAVPCWSEVKELAVAAHRRFNDRVVVGWDIAVLEDGPILVEGNGNPDLDILQRFMRTGLRQHRFARLLVHHLQIGPRSFVQD